MRRLPSLLPILLFLSGAFPSRGLYFLLHDGARTGVHRTRLPALDRPASRTARVSRPRSALPKRLSKMPRALKETPGVPAAAGGAGPLLSSTERRLTLAWSAPPSFRPSLPAPASSRAPPASA